jgi:hypothetical protein
MEQREDVRPVPMALGFGNRTGKRTGESAEISGEAE